MVQYDDEVVSHLMLKSESNFHLFRMDLEITPLK